MNFIGVYEASRRIGLSPTAIYKWIKKGKFTIYKDKVTNKMYLDEKEVEQYLFKKRVVKSKEITKIEKE